MIDKWLCSIFSPHIRKLQKLTTVWVNPNEVESVTQVSHDAATQSKVEGSQLSVLFIDYFVTYRCVKMSNTDIMDVGNILEWAVWVLGCNSLLFLLYLQCI